MKKSKKIICLLLTFILAMSCTTTAFAAEKPNAAEFQKKITSYMKSAASMFENMCKTTDVTLERNNIHTDYRHIKIKWEKVDKAVQYEIQIADNIQFKDADSSKRLSKQGLYWNFSLRENIDATYYVRVRPRFVYVFRGEYFTMYGRWSNVIVANGADQNE